MPSRSIVYQLTVKGLSAVNDGTQKIIRSRKELNETIKLTRKELDLAKSAGGFENRAKQLAQLQNVQKGLKDQVKLYRTELQATGQAASAIDQVKAKVSLLKKEIDEIQSKKILGEKIDISQLDKLQRELAEINEAQKANRLSARNYGNILVASGKTGADAYKRISTQLTIIRNKAKNLEALKLEGVKIDERKLRAYRKEVTRLDSGLKKIDKSFGQSQRFVGEYERSFSRLGGVIKGAAASFGIFFGAQAIGSLVTDAIQDISEVSDIAKGVEFAFNRVSNSQKVLVDSTAATAGLLSDLEIKKSIVEFDNFGLSIEQLPELLKFVAVRAAQTGKSFDSLKDSLVEGLSKESKLRIDNLGISTSELNQELEKTPDFVQAVSNIAKREMREAGDIIDEASSSQQKFNAVYENFISTIGNSKAFKNLQSLISQLKIAFIESIGVAIARIGFLLQVLFATSKFIKDYRVELLALGAAILSLNSAAIIARTSQIALSASWAAAIAIAKSQVLWTNRIAIANRALNVVLKANPIGLVVTGVAAAIVVYKNFFSESSKIARAQKEIAKSVRDSVVEYEKEKRSINDLFKTLKDEKTSRDDKRTAIEKLREIYPDYIGDINLESKSVEELTTLQNDLTESIKRSIIERVKGEKIGELIKEQIRLELRLNDVQKNGINALTTREKIANAQKGNQAKALAIQLKKDIEENKKQQVALNKQFDEAFPNNAKGPGDSGEGAGNSFIENSIKAIKGKKKDLEREINNLIDNRDAKEIGSIEFKSLDKEINNKNKELSAIDALLAKYSVSISNKNKSISDSFDELAQKGSIKFLRDELSKLKESFENISPNDEGVGILIADITKKTNELEVVEAVNKINFLKEQLFFADEEGKAVITDQIGVLFDGLTALEGKIEGVDKDFLSGIIDGSGLEERYRKLYLEPIESLDLTSNNKVVSISIESNAQEVAEEFNRFENDLNGFSGLDAVSEQFDALQDKASGFSIENIAATAEKNAQATIDAKKAQITNLENLLITQTNKEIANAEDRERKITEISQRAAIDRLELDASIATGNKRIEIERQISDAKVELNKKANDKAFSDTEKRLKKEKELREKIADGISKGFSALFEIQDNKAQQNADNQKARLESEYNRRIELAEGNNKEQDRLRSELAKKQEAIDRQEAKRKQSLAIKEAIIQGAVAAIRSFPLVGPAIANTLAQILVIKSQKFEKGGQIDKDGVVRGARHSQGGVKYRVGNTNLELEDGEATDYDEYGNFTGINRVNSQKYAGLLRYIRGKPFKGKQRLLSAINSDGGNGISFVSHALGAGRSDSRAAPSAAITKIKTPYSASANVRSVLNSISQPIKAMRGIQVSSNNIPVPQGALQLHLDGSRIASEVGNAVKSSMAGIDQKINKGISEALESLPLAVGNAVGKSAAGIPKSIENALMEDKSRKNRNQQTLDSNRF